MDRIQEISATTPDKPPTSDRSIRFADERSSSARSSVSTRGSRGGGSDRYSAVQDLRSWGGAGGEISLVGRLSGGSGRSSGGRANKRYTPRSAPPPIIPEEGEEAVYARYEERDIVLVAPEEYEDDLFSRLSDGRISLRLSDCPSTQPAAAELSEVEIQIDKDSSPTGKVQPTSGSKAENSNLKKYNHIFESSLLPSHTLTLVKPNHRIRNSQKERQRSSLLLGECT